jgi:uncharacterized membrane protein YgcG
MSKRVALVSAVLLAALVVAVVGATAALRLIGGGTFGPGGRPLSEADVRRSLAAVRTTPPATPNPADSTAPGGSGTASPHASSTHGTKPVARSGVFSVPGGSVYASCAAGRATLTRWIPDTGYGTDGYLPGPASTAWVKFKSANSEVTVSITCVAGKPHFATSSDDHGGGRGGDGGGHGGGGGGGGSGH